MSDEFSPFMAAILANPDDDLPRLIAADWLEEHDDSFVETCPKCHGKGRTGNKLPGTDPTLFLRCEKCKGTGTVVEGNRFTDRATFIRTQIKLDKSGRNCLNPIIETVIEPRWMCSTTPDIGHLRTGLIKTCEKCEICECLKIERDLLIRYCSYNHPWWPKLPFRTKESVLLLRQSTPMGGCCNRFADMQSCSCMNDAAMVKFIGGFVGRVTCQLSDWFRHGSMVVTIAPIRRVEFSDRMPVSTKWKSGDSRRWTWFSDAVGVVEHDEVINLSDRTIVRIDPTLPADWFGGRRRMNFPTDKEALNWASKKALGWARAGSTRFTVARPDQT